MHDKQTVLLWASSRQMVHMSHDDDVPASATAAAGEVDLCFLGGGEGDSDPLLTTMCDVASGNICTS